MSVRGISSRDNRYDRNMKCPQGMKSTSPVKDGTKPIPIEKTCKICKQKKLLSEFEFSSKARDKRATICKSCMEERKTECNESGHTDICIKNKFLTGVFHQLDCLL